MKQSNKKGLTPLGTTGDLILLSIILVVVIFIFRPTSSEAGTFFSSETLKAKDAKCEFDTSRAEQKGMVISKDTNDRDTDGRLDTCDVCVSCDKGDSGAQDDDLDGMPNYCDKEKLDRTVVACDSGMRMTKDGRCVSKSCPYR